MAGKGSRDKQASSAGNKQSLAGREGGDHNKTSKGTSASLSQFRNEQNETWRSQGMCSRPPSNYMVEPRSTGVSRRPATSCLSVNKLDHRPSWCRTESRFMGKTVGSETRKKSLCFLTPTQVYNTSVYPYCRGAEYAISKYTTLHEDYFEQKASRKSRHRRSLCLPSPHRPESRAEIPLKVSRFFHTRKGCKGRATLASESKMALRSIYINKPDLPTIDPPSKVQKPLSFHVSTNLPSFVRRQYKTFPSTLLLWGVFSPFYDAPPLTPMPHKTFNIQ